MNREDKQKLVLELNKQGKTIREIAQLAHMSFGDICFIIRRETGEAEEQERIRMSKSSQALKMFEEGNTPVQVAIKLDMETLEVDRLYREYWNLKGLHNLLQVYAEIKGSIFSFVKLYQLTKQEGMKVQEVVNALKIVEQLPLMDDEYECIKDNVYAFRYQRQKLENDLYVLNKQKESSSNELESLREDVDMLKYERHELSSLIAQLKDDSDEYSKVKMIVEEKVRKILGTNSLIVGAALLAVLTAVQDDRNNPLLTDLLEGRVDATRIFTSTENNYYRQKLSELARIYYQNLVSDCMKSSLYSITFGFEGQQRQLP